MSDFQKGDLVEAVKGEVRVTDRLADSAFEPGRCYLPTMRQQTYVDALEARGWTLTLLDRPKPKVELPTEPGLYESAQFPVNVGFAPYRLRDSKWYEGDDETPLSDPLHIAPFTKLEPVQVTAKKVLDAVVAWSFGACRAEDVETAAEMQTRLRAEFGVTD